MPKLMMSVTAAHSRDCGSEVTGELDSSDGGRVVIQSLLQTVILLHIEDVDQSISASRRQELHT